MPIIPIIHKTLLSLLSANFLTLIVRCVALTAIVLIGFIGGITFLITAIPIPFEWLDNAIDNFLIAGAYTFAWFLFPLCIPVLAGLFRLQTIAVTEQNHYPSPHSKQKETSVSNLWYGIRFLLKSLLLNIICLPLYLVPGLNLVIYYLLNSYLIGREFFSNVSHEYLPNKTCSTLRKKHRITCISAGFIIVLLSNIPFINLVVPILGTSLMVHVFYEITKEKKA